MEDRSVVEHLTAEQAQRHKKQTSGKGKGEREIRSMRLTDKKLIYTK